MARLMIVEDDPAASTLLEILLVKAGYSVMVANRGDGVIELVHKHKIDLILMDIMMPDMDGIAVTRKIRSENDISNIPIIMLSAVGQMDRKIEAFTAGADDYLTKPVHSEELKTRIHALLSRQIRVGQGGDKKVKGKIVAVLGSSGGVGTSQVVLGMAGSVMSEYPDIIAAELIRGSGSFAELLQLNPSLTLSNIVHLSEADLSDEKIQQAITRHTTGLDILSAGQEWKLISDSDTLHASLMQRLIRYFADNYALTFIDLGSGFGLGVKAIAHMVDKTILVARADLRSIKTAAQLYDLFRENGILAEKLNLILVSVHAPDLVETQAISNYLDSTCLHKHYLVTIPPSFDAIRLAEQHGLPAVMINPQGDELMALYQQAVHKMFLGPV